MVFIYVNQGLPRAVSEDIQVFFLKKHELSVQQGYLLWGFRVIILSRYSKQVLKLHQDHPGTCISRMKNIGRSLFGGQGSIKKLKT